MSEYHNQGEASLDRESVEQMAKYGITCSQIYMFFYGGYRYTSLADAIAEAERHPPVR